MIGQMLNNCGCVWHLNIAKQQIIHRNSWNSSRWVSESHNAVCLSLVPQRWLSHWVSRAWLISCRICRHRLLLVRRLTFVHQDDASSMLAVVTALSVLCVTYAMQRITSRDAELRKWSVRWPARCSSRACWESRRQRGDLLHLKWCGAWLLLMRWMRQSGCWRFCSRGALWSSCCSVVLARFLECCRMAALIVIAGEQLIQLFFRSRLDALSCK